MSSLPHRRKGSPVENEQYAQHWAKAIPAPSSMPLTDTLDKGLSQLEEVTLRESEQSSHSKQPMTRILTLGHLVLPLGADS